LPRRHRDETKIDYLKKIPYMLVTNASTGAWYNIGPNIAAIVGPTYTFSPLNMVCFMFDYWKGDMWVEIKFTASPMIRARYLINVVGAQVTSLPGSNFDNGSNIAKIVEVCGSTTLKIKVPYLSYETLTLSEVFNATAGNVGSKILISQIGAIAGPTASPPAPFIDVWCWADDNMSFACPSLRVVQDMWQVQTGKDAQAIVGESIEDVKELCKRSCLMMEAYNVSNFNPMGVPADGLVPYYDGVSTPTNISNVIIQAIQWTFPTFIRTLFLGSAGGMVHRMDMNYNTTVGLPSKTRVYQPIELPGMSVINDVNIIKWIASYSGASGMQVFASDAIAEVAVQDKSAFLFHSPQRAAINSPSFPCFCVYAARSYDSLSFSTYATWYMGARDDFDVGLIPCSPAFILR